MSSQHSNNFNLFIRGLPGQNIDIMFMVLNICDTGKKCHLCVNRAYSSTWHSLIQYFYISNTLFCLQFCLWDFHREKFLLTQVNLSEISRESTPRNDTSTPNTAVCRVNLVDNKIATVTTQCIVKVWQLDFSKGGQLSCLCLHTLTTFKPRYE